MRCNKGIGTILGNVQKIIQKQEKNNEDTNETVKNINRLQNLIKKL